MSRHHLTDWIVPPVIVPLFLFLLIMQWPPGVANTTLLQFLVSGNNQFSRVNVGCPTAAEALKKAMELVGRGYMDVKICTPRGEVLLPDEFDQLEG